VWISGGSLLLSAAALWRSGRVRVLDIRTNVRTDIAELRLRLDALSQAIPAATQSRANAASAIGTGRAAQLFKQGADADIATIKGLTEQLDQIARISVLSSYSQIEAKSVAAREVRIRLEQLSAKYEAAADDDAATRKYLRESMSAAAAARISQPPRRD
jgi:type II secretory pathway component GspD/PulD (secretin)